MNDPEFGDEYAKALLQHYGLKTHFVDLTTDVRVAAWFASNQYKGHQSGYVGSSMREYEIADYGQDPQAVGYIIVLAIPNHADLQARGRLFDLGRLPEHCVRPHRQKGWLMLDRPPTEPTPNEFWVATIKIQGAILSSDLTRAHLFPDKLTDPTYAAFLSVPFVQVPMAYYKSDGDEYPRDGVEEFCFAYRAIQVPEYLDENNEECVNHKWDDFTIYEPHEMRVWKYWRYLLASMHSGASGDIRDTVKVTLTPEALEVLKASHSKDYSWPQLDSDGLFFTFAGMDHDKVSEHAPPYAGVWLQRDDDMIIEVPMSVENHELMVSQGHAYFLKSGRLNRQEIRNSCRCGSPESHDLRVQAMLRLSALIREGTLILLPHPKLSQLGWNIVITGTEGNSLMPQVTSFQKVMKAIFSGLPKSA